MEGLENCIGIANFTDGDGKYLRWYGEYSLVFPLTVVGRIYFP